MERIKLVEICNPKQWKTIPTGELLDEGYPVYGANGVIGYYDEYNHENPVVAITCRGATCGAINITVPQAYVTGNAMCLDDVRDDIEIDYLYYCLKHYDFTGVISGSAQPQITGQGLNKVDISICSHEEQLEIIDILKKVEAVIKLREEELCELDDLIKARFVELFGDPVTNDKHWDMDTLLGVLEIGRTVTYGIVQTGDDVDEGIPVFRPIDIAGGHVPKREELKKTLPEISDKYKRTLLKGNELLITVRGSVGETFQVNEEFEGCNVGRNIVPLVTDKKRVNQRFLQELFAQKPIKDWLKAITKGIALQGLNMSEFKEMPVIIPDMGLQEEYVEFVEQVDKSKVAVQKSLDETQKLFDSLMQEYFG